jgi:hypothetical protein
MTLRDLNLAAAFLAESFKASLEGNPLQIDTN